MDNLMELTKILQNWRTCCGKVKIESCIQKFKTSNMNDEWKIAKIVNVTSIKVM